MNPLRSSDYKIRFETHSVEMCPCAAKPSFFSKIAKVVKDCFDCLRTNNPADITQRSWKKQRVGEVVFAASLIIAGIALIAITAANPIAGVMGTMLIIGGIGGTFPNTSRSFSLF